MPVHYQFTFFGLGNTHFYLINNTNTYKLDDAIPHKSVGPSKGLANWMKLGKNPTSLYAHLSDLLLTHLLSVLKHEFRCTFSFYKICQCVSKGWEEGIGTHPDPCGYKKALLRAPKLSGYQR